MTEMEQAGLKWDSFTYTAIIMASSTSRDDVISTWSEMIKSGIVPTAAAASEMFKACMASKNGTVALEVLNWLWNNTSPIVDEGYAWTGTNIDVRRKEDSLVPDLYMCSKVLAALSQEGKTAESLILLDKMREKDIKPSTYCYMIVLNALEKSSDWKKAVNLILQMQLRGMQNQYHHHHH
jgi:pentatricopeptide repeat protein